MLIIKVLGEFEVRLNGQPIRIARSHAQQLLACLLLERGRGMPREQLAEMFWNDLNHKQQLSQLRGALMQLNRALGTKNYIVRQSNRLAFNTKMPYMLDAFELLDLSTVERNDVSADRMLKIAQSYKPLMPEFDAAWVVTQRSRLEDIYETQLLRTLLERLIHEQLWEKVIEWGLQALSRAANHGVEPLYVRVMQAHYALGNPRGVSDIYERLQTDLGNIGLQPSKATRDLYGRMLREEEPKPVKPLSSAPEPKITLSIISQPPIHLPDYLRNPPTPLIGRDDMLKRIVQDIIGNEHRQLITLLGIGGIGKTRLAAAAALAAAENFPDGVYFIAVDAARSEDNFYAILADGVHFTPYTQTSLKAQVLSFLQEKKLLLIVDNFETLLEHGLDGAAIIDEVCAKAPVLKVLVTTRQGLQLLRERIFDVDGLDVPETVETPDASLYGAVALFAEIAGRVNDGFTLERELSTVIDICRLLGGTPLAIEIAAALVRTMSCPEIKTRISENLDALVSTWRNISPRQRSLRAVLEYAFSLLPTHEQNVFAQLSVFSDGFTPVAAHDVAQANFPSLRALKDCALVRQDIGARYFMHSFVQQFGHGKLADLGLIQTTEASMSSYFVMYARHNTESMSALQPEWINLLAGMRLAHAAQAWPEIIAYADALCEPWYTQARYGDIRQGMAWACEAAEVLKDEHAESRFFSHWGRACVRQGDYVEADTYFERGLKLAWKLIDSPSIARILYEQAQLLIEHSELDEAKNTLDQCIDIFEELNDHANLGEAFRQKARACHHINDNIEAKRLAENALTIIEAAGSERQLPPIFRLLADIAQELRDLDSAQYYCEKALTLSEKHSNEREHALAHYSQSAIYRIGKHPELALREAQQSVDILHRIGDQKSIAHVTNLLGYIHFSMKNHESALIYLNKGISLLRNMSDFIALIHPLLYLADAYSEIRQYRNAKEKYLEGLDLSAKYNHPLESEFRKRLRPRGH